MSSHDAYDKGVKGAQVLDATKDRTKNFGAIDTPFLTKLTGLTEVFKENLYNQILFYHCFSIFILYMEILVFLLRLLRLHHISVLSIL